MTITLDLRTCHGNTACDGMRADLARGDAMKKPGHVVVLADREAVARTMSAVLHGRCAHCDRPVRRLK